MAYIFHLLMLWRVGFLLASSTNAGDTSPSLSNWKCPHITDQMGISCTCDIPHTLRCSGQTTKGDLLVDLTTELTAQNDYANISFLEIAIHGISHLPTDSFQGLFIRGLVITSGLRSLSNDAFAGIEDTLTDLGLPSNDLMDIPIQSLKKLRNLQRLDLSINGISTLKSSAFPALNHLHYLDLSGNGLTKLDIQALESLTFLKVLNLGQNRLNASEIQEKDFTVLNFLSELSLQSNQLTGTVSPSFLIGVESLTVLNLSYNFFTTISSDALQSCKNLRYLDLSNNKIDIIEDHAFKSLSDLEHLLLDHNEIISISGWSLAHLHKLVIMNIANNALFAVTSDLLHELTSLESLDLTGNDISLLEPDVFNYTPNLLSLRLTGNPLQCDCSISWLWSWLKAQQKLKKEDKDSVVCTTPPALENAALLEVNLSDLTCSNDLLDYYHDSAYADNIQEIRLASSPVSLQEASWVGDEVQLVWHIDQSAIPYKCQGLHIYEVHPWEGGTRQVLADKIAVNCSSERQINQHQIVVTLPGTLLLPRGVYRYCLILLENGSDDVESFLPGCSEEITLTDPPIPQNSPIDNHAAISSLTAGSMGTILLVQTKLKVYKNILPCSYIIFVTLGNNVVASNELNCSVTRQTFLSLQPGSYTVCIQLLNRGNESLADLYQILNSGHNITNLRENFSACTTVHLEEFKTIWTSAPFLTLIFTLPGLGLIITIYIISKKVSKGGGVLWKWDSRATKRAKYFLYTGESISPGVSIDPFPLPLQPESSV